jgi:hypothetical protein
MENPQNKGNYKRFKCGESGDALHFIGKEFRLSDFKDILNKGVELYSIVIEEANYNKGHTTASKASKKQMVAKHPLKKTIRTFSTRRINT